MKFSIIASRDVILDMVNIGEGNIIDDDWWAHNARVTEILKKYMIIHYIKGFNNGLVDGYGMLSKCTNLEEIFYVFDDLEMGHTWIDLLQSIPNWYDDNCFKTKKLIEEYPDEYPDVEVLFEEDSSEENEDDAKEAAINADIQKLLDGGLVFPDEDVVEEDEKKKGDKTTPTETELLNRCLFDNTNHRSYADLYLYIDNHFSSYMISHRTKKVITTYKWNPKTRLYMIIQDREIMSTVTKILDTYFRMKLSFVLNSLADKTLNKDAKKAIIAQRDQYVKVITKAGNASFMQSVSSYVIVDTVSEGFFDELDSEPYVINFKNGILECKTNTFRKRVPSDYYSAALPYDYKPHPDPIIRQELEDKISNIFNNSKKDVVCAKSYMGYSMLGINYEQISLWLVGALACNGKSTFAQMTERMFSTYFKKISNKTFEMGFTKHHKQFADLKGKRIAFLSEMSRKNIDTDLFKDIIGDENLGGNEVMFGTTEDIPITFTFLFTSNNDPSFQTDAGVKRRGMVIRTENQFLSKEDYDNREQNEEDMSTLHVMDKNISKKMKQDDYKLALFHILYEYTLKYIEEEKLRETDGAINEWKSKCEDNDAMSSFLEQYFEKGKMEDGYLIHKDDFLEMYRKATGMDKTSFQNILNDLRRLKITYIRDKKSNVREDHTVIIGKQTDSDKLTNPVLKTGFIIGIKRNDIRIRNRKRDD